METSLRCVILFSPTGVDSHFVTLSSTQTTTAISPHANRYFSAEQGLHHPHMVAAVLPLRPGGRRIAVLFTDEDCVYMDRYSRMLDPCELLQGSSKNNGSGARDSLLVTSQSRYSGGWVCGVKPVAVNTGPFHVSVPSYDAVLLMHIL
jgi:hypothetical protein